MQIDQIKREIKSNKGGTWFPSEVFLLLPIIIEEAEAETERDEGLGVPNRRERGRRETELGFEKLKE